MYVFERGEGIMTVWIGERMHVCECVLMGKCVRMHRVVCMSVCVCVCVRPEMGHTGVSDTHNALYIGTKHIPPQNDTDE